MGIEYLRLWLYSENATEVQIEEPIISRRSLLRSLAIASYTTRAFAWGSTVKIVAFDAAGPFFRSKSGGQNQKDG